ncbi:MAG: protein-L-isoaspartate O-methyltransferase [Candidatus Moranbacteria bacterium CG06_land_8_20_14_3_00_43_56]|nr:MAG: protein-L-isoaspartate O-methyltransferase [Candidatus Moranbacteria bacterium CG06_land_8_20_14_3_00_43_56]PIW93358.1 MAG: protein-L-isoaspartate O-methyltransferase [Candidatus Moranbacteria bacterium CG_4_8_14_3_um_filter_43_15]PJA86003.1 MAG: protein-L-isoaspartate O-methyltransferase [Candidatus Moranbacteria bacterium CG_4_9_14_3_um_filter_44_28]
MDSLVKDLIYSGYLKTDRIIDAFSKIRRVDFVPEDLESAAQANIPLPIGQGQTISQPLTVAFMLEKLEPLPGDKILDVGSGSGWTAVLLAHIVGEKGKVIGMERIKELCDFGINNVSKYHLIEGGRVKIICADGTKGYVNEAPYDRILVSAAAREVPKELKKQLKVGGRLVIPVGSSIWVLEKISDKDFREKEYPGFAFVPLVGEH